MGQGSVIQTKSDSTGSHDMIKCKGNVSGFTMKRDHINVKYLSDITIIQI